MPDITTIKYDNRDIPLVSLSYTLSDGIEPGVVTMVTPSADNIPDSGDLVIRYRDTEVKIHNVRKTRHSIRAGNTVLRTIAFEDRRWKWRFGEISGNYNQREVDGRLRRNARRKSPQDLAKLLLDAMGETNYDITRIPNTTNPSVDWDYDTPAQELQRLCDKLRCKVVLGLNNRVTIYPFANDVRKNLPLTDAETVSRASITKGRPKKIWVATAPVRIQWRCETEAVGLERDGATIKPINDLSYMPDRGWTDLNWQFELNGGQKELDLAKKSVYRWYRITKFVNRQKLDIAIREDDGTIVTYDEFEFLPKLAETVINVEFKKEYKPIRIAGRFLDLGPNLTNIDTNEHPEKASFDPKRRIVTFPRPTFILSDDDFPDKHILPAQVFVDLSFYARSKNTGEIHRWTVDRDLDPAGGPDYVEIENDLKPHVIRLFEWDGFANNPVRVVDNTGSITAAASAHLDRIERDFSTQLTEEASYIGIHAYAPSDTIRSVNWDISKAGSYTRVAVNQDLSRAGLVDAEKRRRRRIRRIGRDEQRIGKDPSPEEITHDFG